MPCRRRTAMTRRRGTWTRVGAALIATVMAAAPGLAQEDGTTVEGTLVHGDDASTEDSIDAGRAEPFPAVVTKFSLPMPAMARHLELKGLDAQQALGDPPDTSIAASEERVLESTNNALLLWWQDETMFSRKTLQQFFGPNHEEGKLFDTRVFFDRSEEPSFRRFYIVAVQKSGRDAATGVSKLWLAISRHADVPDLSDNQWCRYSFDGRFDKGQSWADFPMLGMGADLVVITTNQFRFRDDVFTYATIWTGAKNRLTDDARFCPQT